jgi:hypothetical protein
MLELIQQRFRTCRRWFIAQLIYLRKRGAENLIGPVGIPFVVHRNNNSRKEHAKSNLISRTAGSALNAQAKAFAREIAFEAALRQRPKST